MKATFFSELLFFMLLSLIFFMEQVEGQTIDQIYNPLPYLSLNTTMYGSNLLQIQFIESKPDLIFLSFQVEGIFILNYQDFTVITKKKMVISQVVLVDLNMYALTVDEGIQFLHYDESNKQIVLNGIFNPSTYQINAITLSNNNKYLLLVTNCILKVFQIIDPTLPYIENDFIVEKATSGVDCNLSSIHIFVNDKIAVVSTIREGLTFYDIQSIEQPIYLRTLYNVTTDVQQTYLLKSSSIMFTLSKYYQVSIIWLGQGLGVDNTNFIGMKEEDFFLAPLYQMAGSNTYNFMMVDEEENFLYLGVRTNGIIIYDLTPLYQTQMHFPILVQQLNSNGLAIWISFAPPKASERNQYQFLFLSDGTLINIFEKVPVNLNSNIINLYNSDQCVLMNYTQDDWPWSIVTFGDSNSYVAISSGGDGIVTFDMTYRGQAYQMQTFKRYNVSHDGIQYLSKKKIIILGQSQEGMSFYNATDPYNLEYISEFKLIGQQNDCDDMYQDESESYISCANGFQGFYILKITDLNHPVVYAKVDLILKKNGVESVIFDNNLTFGFYAIREEGVGYFRLTQNGTEIELVSFFPTLGAEYLRFDISSSKQNYVFVADGYQGLTIIDCSDYMNPFILNSISVQGWAVKFTQLFANPSTIIVAQMEKGQISVIDITSIDSGTKISSIQYGTESAFGITSHPNNDFIAFTLAQGFRFCTTKNPLKIHTQVQRYESASSSIYHPQIPVNSRSSRDSLYIGEKVDLIITSFNNPRKIKFDDIHYYYNFQLNSLPPWIQFAQYLSMISIVANLDAINTNKGFNILLIDVLIPILNTDFVMRVSSPTGPITIVDNSQSILIFDKLVEVGLIQMDGYVTDFFNSNMQIELDWYSSAAEKQMYEDQGLDIEIFETLNRILSRASFSYPIQFLVEGSLKFNYVKSTSQYTQQILPLIQSFSSIVTIVLTIMKDNNQFVKQKVDGVIYQYLQQNKIFQISGDIKAVNDFISQKLIISDLMQQPPAQLSNFKVQINITDSINNPLIQLLDISELYFIRNKRGISISQNFQDQYNKQFPKGLTAQDSFIFVIDLSVIEVETDLTFTIKGLMQKGGEWVEINQLSNFWLTFDGTQFRGLPPLSSFNSECQIKMVVNDGYSNTEQKLIIKVSVFPPKQIMIIIVVLISLFSLILGIFLFRKKIHFIFLQKYHQFSQETIICNEMYNKKVVLAPKIYEYTLKLFNAIFASFNDQNQDVGDDSKQKKIQGFISNYRNSDLTICYEEFFKDAYQIYLYNPSKFSQIPEGEFRYNDTRVKISLRSYLAKYILYNNPYMLKIYQRLKKYTLKQNDYSVDWYKDYIEEHISLNQISKNQSINLSKDQNSLNESENRVVFGFLEIKIQELQSAIEQVLDQNELNMEENYYTLIEALKADYYGFDYMIKPKTWRSSIGEVINFKINKTNPLAVYRKIELDGDKNSIMNRIKQFFMLNYKWIGSYKKNLPDWLGYEIYDNVMILSGIPKKQHQGDYKIIIYNRDGYAAQSLHFQIKQKNKKIQGEKNNFHESPKRKKISDHISIYNGNNLNGSVYLNNNSNNNNSNSNYNNNNIIYIGNEKIITNILPQSATLKSQANISSFSKLNHRSSLLNNCKQINEEIRDQKRSFFAAEAGQTNFMSQEGEQIVEIPKINETLSSINSNNFNENITGVNQISIVQFAQNGKKQPFFYNQQAISLISPPMSASIHKDGVSLFNSQTNLKIQGQQRYDDQQNGNKK